MRYFGYVGERIDVRIEAFDGLSCADDTSLRDGIWDIRLGATRRKSEYTT